MRFASKPVDVIKRDLSRQVKNPAASCGASSKEKANRGLLPPNPRLPFIPAASYGGFWLFPINDGRGYVYYE
jgi:hypothetical protein